MEEKRAEELAQITTDIEELTSSTGDPSYRDMTSEECRSKASFSSSRGESAPQPFKKSIAEMEEQQRQPTISMKEFKSLKRADYDKIVEKYPLAYVIRNKKTGLVVQIQAASSYHACKIIGWRPRQVELIEVIDTKKQENAQEVKKEETVETVEAVEAVGVTEQPKVE